MTSTWRIIETRAHLVREFNTLCKKLVASVVHRVKDAETTALQRRINVAASELPSILIEVAGPQIARYAEYLNPDTPGTWQKFINDPDAFSDLLEESQVAENRDQASRLIPKLQQVMKHLSVDEQKEYIKLINLMLDTYEGWLELK